VTFGEAAVWIGLAVICMVGNLAGGYWLGRDVFGHNSDTPFRARLIAHAVATAVIAVLLFASVLLPSE